MTFKTFNLITLEASKKSWKTFRGAAKNLKESEIVSTPEGIEWALRHPEWALDFLKRLKKELV